MDEHTAKAFDTDLKEISSKIKAMAQIVEQQIGSASDILGSGDTVLARQVVAVDSQTDAFQREIEEKAVITIARRQPVAVDLREVVGALRISNDLERIGDLAQNVAKRAMLSAEEFRAMNGVTLRLQHMCELVLEQLKTVIQSYANKDAEFGYRGLARRPGDRCPQQLSVQGTLDLHAGKPAQYHVLHAYAVLRQEHRAHGRPRHEYCRNRLLYREGNGAAGRAPQSRRDEP